MPSFLFWNCFLYCNGPRRELQPTASDSVVVYFLTHYYPQRGHRHERPPQRLFQLFHGLYHRLCRLRRGPGQHLDVSLSRRPVWRRGVPHSISAVCVPVRMGGPVRGVRHRPLAGTGTIGAYEHCFASRGQKGRGHRDQLDSAAGLSGHCHRLCGHPGLGAAQPGAAR